MTERQWVTDEDFLERYRTLTNQQRLAYQTKMKPFRQELGRQILAGNVVGTSAKYNAAKWAVLKVVEK
jgi:hypothetical protein